MKHLFLSKTNPQVVNDIEEAHKRVQYQDPIFDHQEQLESFVETLEFEEASERESKVISWIDPVVSRVLNIWRNRYSPNSKLIEDALKEKQSLEQTKIVNEQALSELTGKIDENKSESKRLVDDRRKFEINSLQGTVHWGGERTTVIFAMVITFLLAISTIYVYLDAQARLWWNQKPIEQKLIAIKHGLAKGISDFEAYVDNGEVLQSLVATLDGVTVSQFLTIAGGSALMLGVASLVFVAGGKMLAGVYSRMNKPSWFYYSVIGLGLLLVIGLMKTYLDIQDKSYVIAALSSEVSEYRTQIKEKEADVELIGGELDQEQMDELQKNYDERYKSLRELQTEAKGLDGWLKVFAFLAEMLIGAWAWITLADYQEKRLNQSGGAEGRVQHFDKVLGMVSDDTTEIKAEIDKIHNDNILITSLLAKLQALLSDIISKEKAETIANNFYQQEVAFAKQVLQKNVHKWQKERKSS